MQKNKRKNQAEENDLQQRLGAKRRFLRVIQPVVYPHEGRVITSTTVQLMTTLLRKFR